MFPIKFRAWNPKFNQMEYQGDDDIETLQSFMHHYGDSKHLMISTGIVDKNNNTIYENDVLGGIFEQCVVVYCDKCKSFQLAIIDEDIVAVDCLSCSRDLFWSELVESCDKGEAEVIGNIYQGVL